MQGEHVYNLFHKYKINGDSCKAASSMSIIETIFKQLVNICKVSID